VTILQTLQLDLSIWSILTGLQTTWDAAQRTGSRGIFVWESTDLINWKNERLVQVEDKTAGMVWAPEAIWDANKGQYLVHWASKFYAASDTSHTGTPSNIKIRFACMDNPSMCPLSRATIVVRRSAARKFQFVVEYLLTKINRHQRLQDVQHTSNLHRQSTNQHHRPQHPSLRKQRPKRLPPFPQG
jgi:hypothetical protein